MQAEANTIIPVGMGVDEFEAVVKAVVRVKGGHGIIHKKSRAKAGATHIALITNTMITIPHTNT
jgi:hypothetical protein